MLLNALAGLAGVVNISSSAKIFQAGVKTQKLHTAQWGLDRIDQRTLPLDGTYRQELFTLEACCLWIYSLDHAAKHTCQHRHAWATTSCHEAANQHPTTFDDVCESTDLGQTAQQALDEA